MGYPGGKYLAYCVSKLSRPGFASGNLILSIRVMLVVLSSVLSHIESSRWGQALEEHLEICYLVYIMMF